MEKEPQFETPKLHQRIDSLRLWALKQGQFYKSALADKIVVFNDSLTSEYQRVDLWAVPAYHKLIGSSQQRETLGTEKLTEITEKIESFISSVEEEYAVGG